MSELSYKYPRTHRLAGKVSFTAVYEAKVRESRGPLTVYGKPNDLPHSRIGLSVSRVVGTAPRRNRIKRLLRESFRLMQHELPKAYDFIIVVRRHEPLKLAEYQAIISDLMKRVTRMRK